MCVFGMKFFEKKIACVCVSFFFVSMMSTTKAAKIGSEKREDEPSGTRARDGFKASSTKERKEKRTTHLINSRKKISLFE